MDMCICTLAEPTEGRETPLRASSLHFREKLQFLAFAALGRFCWIFCGCRGWTCVCGCYLLAYGFTVGLVGDDDGDDDDDISCLESLLQGSGLFSPYRWSHLQGESCNAR
jgi:hypothetical protein